MTYDIAYLLEREAALPEPPELRPTRAAPAPPRPSLADAQAALASELLQAAAAHDEWVRQYLAVRAGNDARA